VKVCAELFSTATKSERVGIPNTIQMNNCSFGYFTFELLEGEERHEDPPQSCTCQPKGMYMLCDLGMKGVGPLFSIVRSSHMKLIGW